MTPYHWPEGATPLILLRATHDLKTPCRRCGKIFKKGEDYRRSPDWSEISFCADCIGFFLSRYSMTWIINDPTPDELTAQSKYDEMVKDILMETREWMWLSSVWTYI